MPGPVAGSERLKGRSFAETRSAVLDLIRSEGEISRSDLSRRSELTEKTISVIVKSLLAAGVIVEAGYARSTGGKRPVLLRLNDKKLYAVGVTFDVARCLLVLCAPDGAEVARSELKGTGTEHPSAMLKRIGAALQRMLTRRNLDKNAVVGICVAMGGRRGVPQGWRSVNGSPDLWEQYPTEEELSRVTRLPVIRENDANCAALGEYWTVGTSRRDFLTVYMAYGIGCGIVIGGSLFHGVSGNAGEIGHTIADPARGQCWCGRMGCLDMIASPRAITDHILASQALRRACNITVDMSFGDAYQRFEQAVLSGVAPAVELFTASAGHVADSVVDLVNTLDLDLICLAGPGFDQLGEAHRQAIADRLDEHSYMRDVHPVTVRVSARGPDAAALGAASVVLHRELTPHHLANTSTPIYERTSRPQVPAWQ